MARVHNDHLVRIWIRIRCHWNSWPTETLHVAAVSSRIRVQEELKWCTGQSLPRVSCNKTRYKGLQTVARFLHLQGISQNIDDFAHQFRNVRTAFPCFFAQLSIIQIPNVVVAPVPVQGATCQSCFARVADCKVPPPAAGPLKQLLAQYVRSMACWKQNNFRPRVIEEIVENLDSNACLARAWRMIDEQAGDWATRLHRSNRTFLVREQVKTHRHMRCLFRLVMQTFDTLGCESAKSFFTRAWSMVVAAVPDILGVRVDCCWPFTASLVDCIRRRILDPLYVCHSCQLVFTFQSC
mmetsp:Transcript_3899/g.7851  ORF Transcript_3899/g.7851 Transcript_3899/m.7851 type:complete len:295 (+) Transcript_3899:2004-2888(+)